MAAKYTCTGKDRRGVQCRAPALKDTCKCKNHSKPQSRAEVKLGAESELVAEVASA